MTNLMPYLIALHLLAAVVWVGGMFFAHQALRPAAASVLEPPQRLPLWIHTFKRFFPWVWLAIALLIVTGYTMVFQVFGGMAGVGLHVHIMQGLGWLMILLYMHVFFVPFKRMQRAVATGDFPAAAAQLAQIRRFVGINLSLGLIVIAIASGGRYF